MGSVRCGGQVTGEEGRRPWRTGEHGTARTGRADQSSTHVHRILIVAPRNGVISALFLSLAVEFLASHFIGTKIRKGHKGFGELEENQRPVSKCTHPVESTTWKWYSPMARAGSVHPYQSQKGRRSWRARKTQWLEQRTRQWRGFAWRET